MAQGGCDSHSRVAVVSAGLRWARTGAVMSSITEQIQHTLNEGDCTGGSTSLRRVAPRRSPASRRRT
jgi:hypothetical protein